MGCLLLVFSGSLKVKRCDGTLNRSRAAGIVIKIKLILFDRGFYSFDLIRALCKADYPYLIFVPKNDKVKKELKQMEKAEKKTINYPFKYYKNKTTKRGQTTLALLKHIFDQKSNKFYDWSFATNQS